MSLFKDLPSFYRGPFTPAGARRRLASNTQSFVEQLELRILPTINVSGQITQDTTWSDTTQTYLIAGDVTILAGITLTIGTNVRVQTDSQFNDIVVNGTMTATHAQFVGARTDITVNSGGKLDLSDQTSVAGESVHYASGSRGTITDSYFTTARLVDESTQMSVSSTSFSSATPVSTLPSLVPQFYDNLFLTPATFLVHGTTSSSVTWNVVNNVSNYLLDGDMQVSSARTLTMSAGISLMTDSQFNDITIDGTLDATGVQFTGTQTDITVHSGGRLNLTSASSVAGNRVAYNSGSLGTIKDSSFTSALLVVDSAQVTVDNNTFSTLVMPVSVTPSLVPELYDNTFSIQASTLGIHGATTSDVAWHTISHLTTYVLDGDLTVSAGTRLDMQYGLTLQTNSQFEDVIVNGTLTTTHVNFTGVKTDITVNNGGRLDLQSGSAITQGSLLLGSGSQANIAYSEIDADFTINAAGTYTISNNAFIDNLVHAVGNASATIDLRNNYWNTTDQNIIATRLDDHHVDVRLPAILFDPWLTAVAAEPTTLAIAPASANNAEGNSGRTPFTFTVTRSGNLAGPTSVSYAVTGSGTAAATAPDFGGVLPTGTVTFAVGETSKSITIQVTGDTQFEPDEGFTVSLSNPTGGATITRPTATGAIFNDDIPPVPTLSISATDATRNEGNSGTTPFTFTVTLGGGTGGSLSVNYAVTGSGPNAAAASDFNGNALPAGIVIFGAGETSKTITINVTGDSAVEPDEGFTVTLSNPTNGAAIAVASADGTILDDDGLRGALSLSFALNSISEAGGTTTGTISRTGNTAAAVVVALSSNDTSEATVPASVTIPAGQSSVTFSVNGVDDAILDGTQTVTIQASAPLYSAASKTIAVTDSELPQLSASFTPSTIAENGGQSALTILRTGDLTGAMVVTLQSSDPARTNLPSSVTIAAGQASAIVTVTAVDNGLSEGTQVISVNASANGYGGANALLSITDDEPAHTFIVTTTADSGPGSLRQALLDANSSSGRDLITFNIGSGSQSIGLLSPLPSITEAIVLNGTTQPGFAGIPLIELNGSGAGDTAGLTISAGSSEIRGLIIDRFQRQGIAIIGGSGNTIQGNLIGTNATTSTGLGNGAQGILIQNSASNQIGGTSPGQANTIADNDMQGIVIMGVTATGNVVSGNSVFSNGGIGIDLDGNGVTPNDNLDTDLGGNRLQNYPTIQGANLSAAVTQVHGVLSSTPNTSFRVEFFTNAAGDAEGGTYRGFLNVTTGPDGTVLWSADLPAVPLGQIVTATATDPDGNTSEFSAPATVNQLPTITAIPDQAFNENATLPLIPFAIGDLETSPSGLTVTATSSNTTLVPNNRITVNGTAANRSLTIIPNANQSGQTTITVTVNDGSGTTSQSFTLSVNDIPAISSISNQATNEDTPTAAIPFAVSDVETPAGQLIVTAHSSKASLIPDGNLILGGSGTNRTITLNPAAQQSGTATITITVRDTGSDGIPNNADDAVTLRSFTFTVNAVNAPPTLNEIPGPVVIDEDAGPQTLVVSGISAGLNENQQILVTATSDHPELVPDPVVDFIPGNSTATITYQPVADGNGSATITVSVRDAGLDGILNNADDGLVTRSFAITVNSVNDAPTLQDATFTVPENLPNGTIVGSVTGSDKDSSPANLKYSITDGNELGIFAIDSNTGEILIANNSRLDREQLSGITLTVKLSDGDPVLPQSATAPVTINVSDVNEFTPVIGNTTFHIAENSPNGTTVGTVTANDADVTRNLSWSITGGNNLGIFSIDPSTGEIRVADNRKLDRELIAQVILNVTVSDGGPGTARVSSNTVAVNIDGVNDSAPQFTSSPTFSIAENSLQVGALLGTDADLPTQQVTYSIAGGADASVFSLSPSGVLTFNNPPDFEHPADAGHDNVYDLIFMATDEGGLSSLQTASVTVTNVGEVARLNMSGPAATWAKKQPPVAILPNIESVGAGNLGGGILTIAIDALQSKAPVDHIEFPSTTSLGTSTGPHMQNGKLVLQLQLKQDLSDEALQTFLRGIKFSTTTKGLKVATRGVSITLSDLTGASTSFSTSFNVRKKA